MKILITGACGMVGQDLIKELETKHELRLVDQVLPEEATGEGKTIACYSAIYLVNLLGRKHCLRSF